MTYIKYLWHITSGFHRTFLLRTLLGVVRVGAVLTFIWLSKTAIDCATGRIPVSAQTLIFWFALMIAAMLAEMVFAQWGRYIESRAVTRMNNALNRRLFSILMESPLVAGRQGFHSGDMLNRLTLDVRTLSNFALVQLPAIIVMGVQLLASFAFLACLNPYLALVPVIVMPICVLAGKLFFRRQRNLTARVRESESDVQVSIQEGLTHRMVLRSLECIGEIDRRLGEIQQRLDTANRRQARLSRASGSMTRFGFIVGYLTAFGWSIFSLRSGLISFGTMTAFIQLVNRIQNPIASLAGYLPAFISTSVALDRLREIDLPRAAASAVSPRAAEVSAQKSCRSFSPKPSPAAERTPLSMPGIRVRDLSFRYDADSREILSGFTHDFRPGSRTMIVGSTGAGKTTLIRLLLGLLTPDSGSIEIYDGNRTIPASADTIGNFAYVPQGNSLLHGTIRENLLLADPGASDDRLAEALHTAAADFVFDLPQGLDTPCNETGAGLSEGQAQRIAIARALLRPGRILLLDEFNSALDADTAALLMQRLDAACPDTTVIIIAHHRTPIAPYCTDQLEIDS